MFKFALFFMGLIFTTQPSQAQTPDVIRFAATDWCPYACAGQDKGIVADYVSKILASYNIQTEIKSYPWARALSMVQSGRGADGLLTAVPAEAPGLLFTSVPIMS